MTNNVDILKTAIGMLCIALTLSTSTGCRRKTPVPEGLLAEAAKEMQGGDSAAARTALEAAVDANPQSLTAQVNLGLICLQMNDLTAAIAALNHATELAPEQPATWEILASLLLRTGNYEGASEVLSRVSKPTEITLTLKALAARQAGNPDGAQLYLEQALKKNRFYSPALYNLAVLQRDCLNAPVEALAAYRLFRETDPKNPRAANSDENFLKSTQPGPGNITATPVIPEVNRDIPLSIARDVPARTTSQDTDSKITPAATPTGVTPEPPLRTPAPAPAAPSAGAATTSSAAQAMIRKAETEIAAGNNDAALLTLKTAVQRFPADADAVWALAVFYDKQLGLQDRANGLYKTFAHMFPEDRRAKAMSATSSPNRQSTRAAVTGDSFFKKGLDHYNRQEWDAAIAAYRQALSLDSKSASCAYNLGLAYKAKEDLDAAVAAFRHALTLEPDMIKALYMLGLTEIHRHRNADALPPLNRLISIQPDFAKAHYLLGTIYQDENRPDTAAFHFERFLELEPNDNTAPQVRRWMEQHRR